MNHFKPQRLDAGAARVEHLLDREYGGTAAGGQIERLLPAPVAVCPCPIKPRPTATGRRSRFNAITIAAAPSLNSTMLPTG